MSATVTKEVDARGSFCPGPLMELIKEIRAGEVGDVIAVLSADPGSRTDIPAWVAKAQHELVAIEDEDDHARIIVRKAR
jgi:tRNA 2-thiouridine synthesizing protein A